MASVRYIQVEGTALKLSNLDKIFYPSLPYTKEAVLKFYYTLGPTVLPYLRDRPFTLKRFPSGVSGESFFEKQCPSHRPSWMATGEFEKIRYCLINDLRSLMWVVNLAAIELHTTLACISDMQRPTWTVFDLDPGPGTGLQECSEVALLIRQRLRSLRLECFPKTSGQKGLHLIAPLNHPGATYSQVTEFARAVAEIIEAEHPDLVVSKMAKKLRHGKVFIDWSQNVDFKTTVSVYSLRAAERPTVSTPLRWEEVHQAARTGSPEKLLTFEPSDVLKRIKAHGDLFLPVLKVQQALPDTSALALPKRRLRFA